MNKGNRRSIALITLGWVLLALVIGPLGDFPLSDDWSYAHSARKLCLDGEVEFLPWTGASLILQTLYGAGLCQLFGFSFNILRASTLVLGWLGTIGLSVILREADVRGWAATLAILLFALNPLVVNLSFTFMTDVPFAVTAIWASVFYLRGLRSGRPAELLVGAVLAGAAVLIRQHGVFLGAAAALAALVTIPRLEPKPVVDHVGGNLTASRRIVNALAAGLVPVAALVGYFVWIYGQELAPSGLDNKIREARDIDLVTVVNVTFRAFVTLAAMLAPFAFTYLREAVTTKRNVTIVFTVLVAAPAAVLFAREGALMFYLPNVMFDLGVGPIALRDTQFLGMAVPWAIGDAFEVPLTIFACAAAVLLGSAWSGALQRLREPSIGFLALACAALFTGSLLHTYYYFDRYLIAVLPFAAALTAALLRSQRANSMAWIAAALIGAFGVAGTHDYMAWNRVRFETLRELGSKGVRPIWIDGGFEYNAWLFAALMQTWPTDAEARRGQPVDTKSWWWVVHDDIVVSLHELSGYKVYRREIYSRWLPPGKGELLFLLRDQPKAAIVVPDA